MNQDMVFWGVIVCLLGSIAVPSWLFYVSIRNANRKSQEEQAKK